MIFIFVLFSGKMSFCRITGEKYCKCQNKMDSIDALQVDIKATMRKLFTDHAVYTKFVINGIVDGSNDVQALLLRLLQNQSDIGDQLAPIIGKENGKILTELLQEHIEFAGEVIMQAKAGNDDRIATKRLFANSRAIASFLSSLSDKLPFSEFKSMFDQHNQFVIDMTVSRLQQDYETEIVQFDAYYNAILEMSDSIVSAF